MTINQLLAAAGIIKNETTPKANTHVRIGTMMENIINYIPTAQGGMKKHFYQPIAPCTNSTNAAGIVDAGDEWTSTKEGITKLIKYTWTGYVFIEL